MEKLLAEAHHTGALAMGQLALALAAKRGVTKGKLLEWATSLREAAQILEDLTK